jgi:predicted HicB family RNase H-like nuclease
MNNDNDNTKQRSMVCAMVDADLHREARVWALRQGVTLRDLVEQALRNVVCAAKKKGA